MDEGRLLEIAGRWLRALTDGSAEVIALTDAQGHLQYLSVSGAVQQMLGYSAREIAGKGPADLVHPVDLERVIAAFEEVACRPGHRVTVNLRLRHQDGQYIQVQSTAVNRLDDNVVGAIVVHTRKLPVAARLPMTAPGPTGPPSPSGPPGPTARLGSSPLAQAWSSAARPGRTVLIDPDGNGPTEVEGESTLDDDPPESVPITVGRGHLPTGTAGREAFLRAVEEAIQVAHGDPASGFAVVVVEFERPKMLLGNFGPTLVDQLMLEAGRRLVSVLGPGDAYCALETGEFAVLLQGAGDRGRAEALAQRVQHTLARRYHIEGETVAINVIAGIATSERRYTFAEHVLRDAALAATRARGPGKQGRAVYQTRMRVEDTRYMALVSALHGALQGGQLRVYYQPIVSLKTHSLMGFEALVRWQHPERGLLPPGEFIRAAEDTGLIVPMDRWVMREACRQMAHWNAMFSLQPPLHVSVNLSATQVGEELEEHVERVLQDSGLAARQLKLEVTESAVLENVESVTDRIQRLKELGVKLALDDFGTGYSSFSHLCQLPYDTLKIDQSFVARLGAGQSNVEIVNAIVVLAHNLRMDVVAEGVETTEQAAKLGALGCENAQGYFFARPLDPEAAGALIASRPSW